MEECSAVQGEDGDTAVHSCTGSADSFWSCECGHDGDVHEPSDSAACRSALKAECGATDAELDTCHQPGFGTCIPGAGGTWQCACEGEDALEDVAETSCDSALWSHCGESCMRGASNCTPDANGSYDCYCDYYDRSRVIGATNCEEALDRCEPGQGPCATTTGFCDESNEGGFHYECYCLDGSTGTRTPEELGGEDVCSRALEQVCGIQE